MNKLVFGLVMVLALGMGSKNAFAFGGGSNTVEEITQLANDAEAIYNSATNYYYGNTHIHLEPGRPKALITVTYHFRSAPTRVTLVQIKTKEILGVRMIPSQEAVFNSTDQLLADKRISEKVKAKIRGEILPLIERTNAEAEKIASSLQEEVNAKKLSQSAANAQLKERLHALVSKAVATYPNVSIR